MNPFSGFTSGSHRFLTDGEEFDKRDLNPLHCRWALLLLKGKLTMRKLGFITLLLCTAILSACGLAGTPSGTNTDAGAAQRFLPNINARSFGGD
jgi:hypothetical protein